MFPFCEVVNLNEKVVLKLYHEGTCTRATLDTARGPGAQCIVPLFSKRELKGSAPLRWCNLALQLIGLDLSGPDVYTIFRRFPQIF